jgi:hypothetical protein
MAIEVRVPRALADLIAPPHRVVRPPVTDVSEAEVWLRREYRDAWPSLEGRMEAARRLLFVVYLRHVGRLTDA